MCKIAAAFMILVFMFSSCNESTTTIKYLYKDVTIIRIDSSGETSFYYKKSNQKKSRGRIVVKYSGINDGFSGYMRFTDNSRVELLSGDGYFQSENLQNVDFSYKRIVAGERPKLGGNVYYITLSKRYELKKNAGYNSAVRVEYDLPN